MNRNSFQIIKDRWAKAPLSFLLQITFLPLLLNLWGCGQSFLALSTNPQGLSAAPRRAAAACGQSPCFVHMPPLMHAANGQSFLALSTMTAPLLLSEILCSSALGWAVLEKPTGGTTGGSRLLHSDARAYRCSTAWRRMLRGWACHHSKRARGSLRWPNDHFLILSWRSRSALDNTS